MTSEVLQQLDLPERPLGEDLLAEDIGDLLDRYTLAVGLVGRSTAQDRQRSVPVSGKAQIGRLPSHSPNNSICALA